MMTPWVLRLIIASVAVRAGDAERWSTISGEDLHPVNRQELDRVLAKLRSQ